jgi:hypothetical protein
VTSLRVACSTGSFARCQTIGCGGRAMLLCDYPVKRKDGKQGRCNRHVCASCAKRVEGRHFCPPHARVGLADLVKICGSCYSSSCAHGEIACEQPGKTRLVTAAEWKRLLSFGVP